MVVQTQDRHLGHSGAVGLHIGAENAEQFFPREMQHIELEIDHLRIVCSLEASFWKDHPEIHDHRLSCWLESKRNSGKLSVQAAPVAMIPSGKFSFRLQILSKEETESALAGPPAPAFFSPTVAPTAMLERRKHSLGHEMGHKPERRKVARLKSDDRKSAAANN